MIADLDSSTLDNKFIVKERRILRFLRATGNVGINIDKQTAKPRKTESLAVKDGKNVIDFDN